MDEVLLKRLLGACVLFGAVFALTWLLPDAGPEISSGEPQAVVFDLNSGTVASPAPGKSVEDVLPAQPPTQPKSIDAAEMAEAGPPPGWYVQAGSFSNQENARRALTDLHRRELPVSIQLTLVGRETWYRVRVGPYPDEKVARSVLEGLPKTTYQGARLFHVAPES